MNHEELEDHEESSSPRLRIPSPLSPEEELVMSQTIDASIAVQRVLGPGFLEKIFVV